MAVAVAPTAHKLTHSIHGRWDSCLGGFIFLPNCHLTSISISPSSFPLPVRYYIKASSVDEFPHSELCERDRDFVEMCVDVGFTLPRSCTYKAYNFALAWRSDLHTRATRRRWANEEPDGIRFYLASCSAFCPLQQNVISKQSRSAVAALAYNATSTSAHL